MSKSKGISRHARAKKACDPGVNSACHISVQCDRSTREWTPRKCSATCITRLKLEALQVQDSKPVSGNPSTPHNIGFERSASSALEELLHFQTADPAYCASLGPGPAVTKHVVAAAELSGRGFGSAAIQHDKAEV
eukprot:4230671-Amphidinium_carterae.1